MSMETRAFYKDVMGFPIDLHLDNWVSFRVGATLLTLRPSSPGLAWDDGPTAPGSAAVQLASASPLRLAGWHHWSLFFRDPEDNVLEIYAEI
jgi:catechol 2,3-dioxygenase-like lactoylglutathione lyase family enzyme